MIRRALTNVPTFGLFSFIVSVIVVLVIIIIVVLIIIIVMGCLLQVGQESIVHPGVVAVVVFLFQVLLIPNGRRRRPAPTIAGQARRVHDFGVASRQLRVHRVLFLVIAIVAAALLFSIRRDGDRKSTR